MAQDEGKGSAAEVPAQVGGLELKYIDSADIQERANILLGTFTFDDPIVSTDAKDFISKVRHVSSAGKHGTLNLTGRLLREAIIVRTHHQATRRCT